MFRTVSVLKKNSWLWTNDTNENKISRFPEFIKQNMVSESETVISVVIAVRQRHRVLMSGSEN